MIEATEVGRRLRILVGGEEEFLLPPTNSEGGARLLGGFFQIGFLLGDEDGTVDAIDMTERAMLRLILGTPLAALGDDPVLDAREQARVAEADAMLKRVDTLRPEEIHDLYMTGFFWQATGGTLTAAQTYAAGGEEAYPKALELLMERAGMSAGPGRTFAVGALQNLLSTVSDSPTPTDGSPATTTPSATASPSPAPTSPPSPSPTTTLPGDSFRRSPRHA